MATWVDRGVGDHAVFLRPRDPLTAAQSDAIVAAATKHLGKPYDLAFGWSDERMYCSELVYKAYAEGAGMTLTELRTHADYDLADRRAKAAAAKRYPSGLPEEPVVAPSDLMASEKLVEIGSVP